MSELSKLPNVGKVLENNLLKVGIETPEKKNRLEEALAEYERGEYKTFASVEELMKDLNAED